MSPKRKAAVKETSPSLPAKSGKTSDPLAWAREAHRENSLRLQLEDGRQVPLNETQLGTVTQALHGVKYDDSYLKIKLGSLSFLTMSGQMLPVTAAEAVGPSAASSPKIAAAPAASSKKAASASDKPPLSQTAPAASAPAIAPGLSAGAAVDIGGDMAVHSGWSIGYAASSESRCELTAEVIEQGTLRIGKEVPARSAGMQMTVWHTVEALFASFCKGAAGKARITNVAELEGFDDLSQEDQSTLRERLDKAEMNATRLEHTKDGGMFWQIAQSGRSTRTHYGVLGTAGAITDKEHANEAAAAKYVEKMVQQKLKGGYQRGPAVSSTYASMGTKWKNPPNKE